MSDEIMSLNEEDEMSISSVVISLAILLFACYMTYITFLALYDSPLGILILVGIAMLGGVFAYLLLKKYNLLGT